MTRTQKKVTVLAASCGLMGALVGGVGVWAAQGGPKLIFNGRVASTSVRMVNGKAYAPLADFARANGMVVVPVSGGYEIKKAGGATPIAGLRGKVGDVLFDGKWRFQVLSVNQVDSYRLKNKITTDYAIYNSIADLDDNVFTAKNNNQLIAISTRVTNGRNKTAQLWIANSDTRTALADTSGESYPPIAYDMQESGPFHSKALLPGAKTDVTVLFSVPEGTNLKDLVFTLRTINNTDKGSDARVSLN